MSVLNCLPLFAILCNLSPLELCAQDANKAAAQPQGAATCPGDRKPKFTQNFRDYTVTVFGEQGIATGDDCLQIRQKNMVIWSQSPSAEIGKFEFTSIPIGTDFTGGGEPDVAVTEWSGGVHCCWTVHLFQIGATFGKIDDIYAGHSDPDYFQFVDVDGDRSLEFVGTDWTFAYWKTSFAYSPTVKIVLKYARGKYRLATDLMRSKEPSTREMQEIALHCKQLYSADKNKFGSWWQIFWSEVLKLVYSGNAKSALQLIDLAWPADGVGPKNQAIDDLRQKLSQSPYYSELTAMNGGHIF